MVNDKLKIITILVSIALVLLILLALALLIVFLGKDMIKWIKEKICCCFGSEVEKDDVKSDEVKNESELPSKDEVIVSEDLSKDLNTNQQETQEVPRESLDEYFKRTRAEFDKAQKEREERYQREKEEREERYQREKEEMEERSKREKEERERASEEKWRQMNEESRIKDEEFKQWFLNQHPNELTCGPDGKVYHIDDMRLASRFRRDSGASSISDE